MSEQRTVRIMEVVPYSEEWPVEYEKESKAIKDLFNDEIINIYHVGSTSIPGIYAKPVIDILVEVKDIEMVDSFNISMENIGYTCVGEGGIPGRRYFYKGGNKRTHHVHMFKTGSEEISRHLNFRDYMIAHPEEAKDYEELKKQLADKFKYNSEGYVSGKDAFIKDIDKKAEQWAKEKSSDLG